MKTGYSRHTQIIRSTLRMITGLFAVSGALCFHRVALAQPPAGYPDTRSYSSVVITPQQMISDPLHNSVVVFRIEENIVCSFNPLGDVVCQGHSPLYFSEHPHNNSNNSSHTCPNYMFHTGVLGSKTPAEYIVGIPSQECVPTPNPRIVLRPRQKISYNAAECALGDNHVFSCTNQVHGFVLRPGKNNWFF